MGKPRNKICCKDLGNWFFQYVNQANEKVYECDVCENIIIYKQKEKTDGRK